MNLTGLVASPHEMLKKVATANTRLDGQEALRQRGARRERARLALARRTSRASGRRHIPVRGYSQEHSGKLIQRIGSVIVEKSAASVQGVASQMTAQQSEAVGPVEENASFEYSRRVSPCLNDIPLA